MAVKSWVDDHQCKCYYPLEKPINAITPDYRQGLRANKSKLPE